MGSMKIQDNTDLPRRGSHNIGVFDQEEMQFTDQKKNHTGSQVFVLGNMNKQIQAKKYDYERKSAEIEDHMGKVFRSPSSGMFMMDGNQEFMSFHIENSSQSIPIVTVENGPRANLKKSKSLFSFKQWN